MSLRGIAHLIFAAVMSCAPLIAASGQDQPEPSLPAPIVLPDTADSNPGTRAGTTADAGIGEVGQRLDGVTQSVQAPRSPLLRIQSRVENRIRNRIDRNYDPTSNAIAPFERAERRAAPF